MHDMLCLRIAAEAQDPLQEKKDLLINFGNLAEIQDLTNTTSHLTLASTATPSITNFFQLFSEMISIIYILKNT